MDNPKNLWNILKGQHFETSIEKRISRMPLIKERILKLKMKYPEYKYVKDIAKDADIPYKTLESFLRNSRCDGNRQSRSEQNLNKFLDSKLISIDL